MRRPPPAPLAAAKPSGPATIEAGATGSVSVVASGVHAGVATLVVVSNDDVPRAQTSWAPVAAATAVKVSVVAEDRQVTPPSVVTSIRPTAPTAQPWRASLKATARTACGARPGSAGRVQVAPPLVLTAIVLPSPTTTTPVSPKVAICLTVVPVGNGSATFTQGAVAGAWAAAATARGATVMAAAAAGPAKLPASTSAPSTAAPSVVPAMSLNGCRSPIKVAEESFSRPASWTRVAWSLVPLPPRPRQQQPQQPCGARGWR